MPIRRKFDWLVTIGSGGTIEFRGRDGRFIANDLDPVMSFFEQVYWIIGEHNIEDFGSEVTPVVMVQCGREIYTWDFEAAHYCFIEGLHNEDRFERILRSRKKTA